MEVSEMQENGGRSIQSNIELRCCTWAVIFCMEHINILPQRFRSACYVSLILMYSGYRLIEIGGYQISPAMGIPMSLLVGMACGISKQSVGQVSKQLVPFVVVEILCGILFARVPGISLLLPSIIG